MSAALAASYGFWHAKSEPRAVRMKNTGEVNRKLQLAGRPLRIGFVPLADCAPFLVARELGLFARHGLNVQLSREIGWATLRDKLVYGELDAAHAPGPMLFALNLGMGSRACGCVTGLVLNHHGNTITLSRKLWREGVRDGNTLRAHLRSRRDPLVLGVPFLFASHQFLLRKWLKSHGIEPGHSTRLVVAPPLQMPDHLQAGHLDGYCAGEPWGSVAAASRTGWIAATSEEVSCMHPEKVLAVTPQLANQRPEEHTRLIAALLEACQYCESSENYPDLLSMLVQSNAVAAPIESLRPGFGGKLNRGDASLESSVRIHRFYGADVNEPTAAKADWIIQNIREAALCPSPSELTPALTRRIFRPDIFKQAQGYLQSNLTDSNHENAFETAKITN